MRRLALVLGAGVLALFGVPVLFIAAVRVAAWVLSVPLSEDARGGVVVLAVFFGVFGAFVAGMFAEEAGDKR